MSSTLQSLMVKEWHEQKWRCASLSAICLSVVAFAMVRDPEVVIVLGVLVIFFLAFPGTVFIAMGVAAGERAGGTLELLRVLPIKMRKIAAVRLIAGAVTCLTPIFFVMVLVGGWLGAIHLLAAFGHESASRMIRSVDLIAGIDEFAGLAAAAICCCVSVYLWVIAVGIRQRTELRAGLVGIGVLVGWFMLLAFIYIGAMVLHPQQDPFSGQGFVFQFLFSILSGMSPYGLVLRWENTEFPIWWISVLQVVSGCLLIMWVLRRYGEVTHHDNASPTQEPATADDEAIGHPRRSAVMAVAWKQWRDTVPMAAIGLAFITLFAVGPIIDNLRMQSRGITIEDTTRNAVSWISETSMTIGVMLALLVGVGTFVGDYQPGMLTFWRSRPISPRLWFWSKYLTGLVVVEVTMISPWIMAQVVTGWYDLWTGPGYLVTAMVLYLFVYSASVWMACLLRHTVYAGVMAAGVVALVLIPPTIEPALQQFSMNYAQFRGGGDSGNHYWMVGYYLLPYLCWMVPATAMALWLATGAARRESAFEFGR